MWNSAGPPPDYGVQVQRRASVALDRAKTTATWVCLFDHAVGRESELRDTLLAEVAHALFDGQIEPWLQPIVRGRERQVVSAEVLARWRHPRCGVLSPGLFLPLLTERNLLDDMFAHMLRGVAPHIKRWAGAGLMKSVSVNVSPSQLQSGRFADDLRDLLLDLDLPGELLTVEVTEEVATKNFAEVREQFARIGALGVRLALDDFGVGYANVAILRHLSFDTLKVDRSLTRDAADDERAGAVLRSIVGLADALGMVAVAEGVEHERQALALAGFGLMSQQGYLYGAAAPADLFEQLLQPACLMAP